MTYQTLEAAPRLTGILAGLNAQEGLLIGGTMRAASDRGSFDVADPACGEPFATVANATVEDARAAADAAAAALPEDLMENTMLGDTGANAVGAVVGTALAAHPSRTVRGLAALVGTALVLASERVSFTRVIDRTPVLAALDGLGRRVS